MRARAKLAGLLVVLAMAPGPVAAEEIGDPWQEEVEPVWPYALTLAAEPMVSMPIGDYGTVMGVGIGAGARVSWRPHPNLRVYARGAAVFHLVKNEINTFEYTGAGGIELFPRGGSEMFWFEGGITHLRFKEGPGLDPLDPLTDPSAGFGVGYDAARFGVKLGAVAPSIRDLDYGVTFVAILTIRAAGFGAAP